MEMECSPLITSIKAKKEVVSSYYMPHENNIDIGIVPSTSVRPKPWRVLAKALRNINGVV